MVFFCSNTGPQINQNRIRLTDKNKSDRVNPIFTNNNAGLYMKQMSLPSDIFLLRYKFDYNEKKWSTRIFLHFTCV